MVPRLLDIEFLPLKPAFKLLRLSENDGNFPPQGWKVSIPGTESFPSLGWKVFRRSPRSHSVLRA